MTAPTFMDINKFHQPTLAVTTPLQQNMPHQFLREYKLVAICRKDTEKLVYRF